MKKGYPNASPFNLDQATDYEGVHSPAMADACANLKQKAPVYVSANLREP